MVRRRTVILINDGPHLYNLLRYKVVEQTSQETKIFQSKLSKSIDLIWRGGRISMQVIISID